MQILKGIILILVFASCSGIGILLAKKYADRVEELKQIKASLNIFETKVKMTYEPIPKIFSDIAQSNNKKTETLFKVASKKMQEKHAGQAWQEAIEQTNLSINKEDKNILKGLSKMLGKVDVEGQVSEIKLVQTFLDTQIEEAENEKKKNTKMYKTLGVTTGLAIVIILI